MNREGDVVLIHYEDQPAVFARIEYIEPDIKKDWYHVTFLFFTIPTQTVTWILRRAYINGESFTMGGRMLRLEKVESVVKERKGPYFDNDKDSQRKDGKIIPFKKK